MHPDAFPHPSSSKTPEKLLEVLNCFEIRAV
jgi:hypothetical protein